MVSQGPCHCLARQVSSSLGLALEHVWLWTHGVSLCWRAHLLLHHLLLLLLLLKHTLLEEALGPIHAHARLAHLGCGRKLAHRPPTSLHSHVLLHTKLGVACWPRLLLGELTVALRHAPLLLLLLHPEQLLSAIQLGVAILSSIHHLALGTHRHHALGPCLLRRLLLRHHPWPLHLVCHGCHGLHSCLGPHGLGVLLWGLLLRLVGLVLCCPLFNEGSHEVGIRFEDVENLLLLLGGAGRFEGA